MFADPWFFDKVDNNVVEIDGKFYSVILKNGTTSIESKLGHRGEVLRDVWISKYDQARHIDEPFVVNVILRDPVSRYFSGLATTKRITEHHGTGMGQTMDAIERLRSNSNDGWYFDPHMFPQYWWLISAYISTNCSPDLHFRFLPIDELDNILGNAERLNVSDRAHSKDSSAVQRNIIKQRYNIDLQTWNNMLYKTMNYEQWVEEIGKNIREYFSNKKHLKNESSFPRFQKYHERTNPMKNVDNFDLKIEQFNKTLEKIEEIVKKTKL